MSVDEYSYQVGYERAVNEMFDLQIRALCDLIAQYPHLWVYGDGYGGDVRYRLEKQFDAYGFPRHTPEPSTRRNRALLSKRKVIAVMQKSGGVCVVCGSADNLQVDHIVPHSKGGSDQVENLQMLCQPCNGSKGDRSMDEWLGKVA